MIRLAAFLSAAPLTLFALLVLPPVADAHAERPQQAHRQQTLQHAGDVNLPAWARPNQHRRGEPARPMPREMPQQPNRQQMPPGFPQPSPAPLGGLEWLALAGGGYALNRLRRRDGSPDGSDDAGGSGEGHAPA